MMSVLADRGVGFQKQIGTPTSGGRPKGVDQKKVAVALRKEAGHSVCEICEIVGIARNTYYKNTRGR